MGKVKVSALFFNSFKKLLCNHKGLTLVEVLCGIILISIVVVLATSMHLFGQKQYNTQSKDIQTQSNLRLAMNILTKQIRSAESIPEVTDSGTLKVGNDVFKLANNNLTKNNGVIARDISSFNVKKEENQITINLSGLPDDYGKKELLSTVLYIRVGEEP